ncbi:MAG: PDR/VanB family oxidoreductase [Natronosporangium sp.]
MTGERRLRVGQLRWECEGVLSVMLVDPDGFELPPWEPGAHIDLHLGGQVRQYSLCSDPADRDHYQVAVLLAADSRGGSAYVHERLRPGELVRVGGPRNNFPLDWSPRYLFLAGGIGITPILPMVRAVAAAGRQWRLVYGGRRWASMAFLAELETFGDPVEIVPEDRCGVPDLDALLGTPAPDTLVYSCGPEPMLAGAEACCAGWPAGSLRLERFRPRPSDPATAAPERSFQVVCQRSGAAVQVPTGVRIVDALEEVGVWIPSACREGICGTCETRVIEGTPEHRDSLLSAADRGAGKLMYPCVSRSRSPTLVLDV